MLNQYDPTIICVMGPTATGKTDLASRLIQKIPADIISVDSAMVYRGMDICTAKPTSAELKVAPHWLINLRDPMESYSAGQFCSDALKAIDDIFLKHRTPLLVGGTMLYFHKLLFGLADLPTANEAIRIALAQEAEKIGWLGMHEKLQKVDPASAQKIKPQDPQRISRALEVFLMTGKPISVLQKNQTPLLDLDRVVCIALIPEDRAWLHQRIALRFENMLKSGLIDEVRQWHERTEMKSDLPSMRIVGYRQVWEYLDGKIDYETMKQKAIAATRQLAKRQMTWLRSWKNLAVFDPQDPALLEKVFMEIKKK